MPHLCGSRLERLLAKYGAASDATGTKTRLGHERNIFPVIFFEDWNYNHVYAHPMPFAAVLTDYFFGGAGFVPDDLHGAW